MRGLLARLVALVAVVLLGGYYILTSVLHFSFGNGPFDVALEMNRAGGIYKSATVTYNGVDVGSVSAVDVEPQGVRLTLALDHGTRIPSDVDANIRQLSAVGEQYVDLVPASSGGPMLRAGSVIPASRSTVPLAIGTALDDLSNLLASIDEKNLATVRSFLTTGFSGTGPDLRNLIVSGQQLTRALQAAQPATVDLITQGNPVLKTLNASNADFAAYTRNLNELTAQLKVSDADIRGLLAQGAPATEQLAALLGKTRDDIAGTIAGFGAGSAAVLQYQPQVQRMFQLLPVVALDLRDITAGGNIRSTLGINVGNTVCTYLVPQAIPLPTQRTGTADLNNGCARTAPDLLQRGADLAPGPAAP